MLEYLSASFLYSLVKDAWGWIFSKGRENRKTHVEIIALQQKFKPVFEGEITKNWRDKLRRDIVIRDVRRFDKYPDIDEKAKGISPWFRVGLIQTYHRGILVGLQWERLVAVENGKYRTAGLADGADQGLKVILAGRIPYENIESVDLEGDEYYSYPHVYCHFSHKKSPYEDIGYYEEKQNPGGRPFYTERVKVSDVSRPPTKRRWYSLRRR